MSCSDCVRGKFIANLRVALKGLITDNYLGVLHEGVAEGKFEQIAGVACYVATPTGDYAKGKVVLYLSDIFGLRLINSRLLADGFARNGYKTIMPDILNGDAIKDLNDPSLDIMEWLSRHGPETWTGSVDNVVASLKAEGVTRIATTGYCFGAPPAFYLACKNESVATVVSHPSHLKCPEDFEKYKAESKAPLLINSCEVDSQFPLDQQAIADDVLGGGKFAPGYERTYWDGCVHGFAVRGDLSDPKVKAGMEGSFAATVDFFKNNL
ncbi:hypothetical protein PHLCEN_2v7586 [Hermanssonia centrifuga]|uniref:Dienelactone hydrolase domain-containing protein n=1 Tax=Hermanssonia centrifuga TaxID=98765 RepID=A0A2R6NW45_9APHY|nr:hypothetical protein PHLCEN_2v7586 [Hermanssonia centrifuga]